MIAPAGMDNEKLGALIQEAASEILESRPGFWKFKSESEVVFVITDESHNRMRILTPVAEIDSISLEQCQVLLAANFDRALDARYCLNDNVIWSAYLHPLRELISSEFLSALSQVVTLSKNFGTSFTSTDIVFGG